MKPKPFPLRLFDRDTTPSPETQTGKYQRHMDSVDLTERLDLSGDRHNEHGNDNSGRHEKTYREIHFAFLPERYQPLIDDEAKAKAKEEKKKRKKENYKKVKKNVGKALRGTWKCLMLGLYNFALGYSTPITVAATFVPDFHPGRNRT